MRLLYTLLAGALLLSACEMTKDISYSADSQVRESIVVNGMLESDSLNYLFISRSSSRFSAKKVYTQERFTLPKALVTLSVNGKVIGTTELKHGEEERKRQLSIYSKPQMGHNNNALTYPIPVVLKSGDKVHVEVSAEGFETAIIDVDMPARAQLRDIQKRDYTTNIPQLSSHDYSIADHNEVYHDGGNEGSEPADRKYTYRYYEYTIDVEATQHPTEEFLGVAVTSHAMGHDGHTIRRFNDPIGVHNDISFSKESQKIATHLSVTHGESNILIVPYFSSGTWAQKHNKVLFTTNATTYNKAPNRVLLYTLSPIYYEYAAMRYGNAHLRRDSDSFDITEQFNDMMGERRTSLSNVRNGRGLVLTRTATLIDKY